MRTILDFESAEAASKICCVSDAQNLVDFICYVGHSIYRDHLLICSQLVSNKKLFQWWNSRVASNASLLALEIYARTPVVPQSLFLNKVNLSDQHRLYMHILNLQCSDCDGAAKTYNVLTQTGPNGTSGPAGAPAGPTPAIVHQAVLATIAGGRYGIYRAHLRQSGEIQPSVNRHTFCVVCCVNRGCAMPGQ
jgi:hypothetical protein